MIQYPLSFSVEAQAPSGIQQNWTASAGEHLAKMSIPPEFEGPGGAFSPEDLFALALSNCFVATFKVYAEKSKLQFSSVKAQAKLIVDLDEQKKPIMKSMTLEICLKGVENQDRARMLVERALKSGFILNSVKTNVTAELNFEDAV